MALVIWNPTNETFKTQYIGEHIEMEPGKKVRVDDARGRALLSQLAPRGLVALEYGDEGEAEEAKGEQGRKRNFEFKKRQVIRYNQQNEAHKQSRLPFITPPDQIKEYAKDIGIKLLEPYSFKDTEVTEIASLRQDKDEQKRYINKLEKANATQAEQLADMGKKLDRLMNLFEAQTAGQPVADTPEKKVVDLQKIRDELKFKHVTNQHFKNWVARNWDKIHAAPAEIVEEIKTKYINAYNMPFPTERPDENEGAAA